MKFANRIRLVHRANKTRVTVGVIAGIQVLTSDLTTQWWTEQRVLHGDLNDGFTR